MRRANAAKSRLGVSVMLSALLLLAGCTGGGTDLADQYSAGNEQGYIVGDGTITTIAAPDRGEPVDFAAATAAGEQLSVVDLRGDVVVLNFWYANCPPCRVEAPDLQAVADDTADDGVQFVGVNIRDDAATAQAFERSFDIGYPSVLDDDGQIRLALRGQVPPSAVPSTLVLDREGRVAARVLGAVSRSTLGALVDDAVAEDVTARAGFRAQAGLVARAGLVTRAG